MSSCKNTGHYKSKAIIKKQGHGVKGQMMKKKLKSVTENRAKC